MEAFGIVCLVKLGRHWQTLRFVPLPPSYNEPTRERQPIC